MHEYPCTGAYFFAMEDTSNEFIDKVWHRSATGGYNKGCLVIAKPRGILVKKMDAEDEVLRFMMFSYLPTPRALA